MIEILKTYLDNSGEMESDDHMVLKDVAVAILYLWCHFINVDRHPKGWVEYARFTPIERYAQHFSIVK